MPLAIRRLGDVLLRIYDFPFEACIYLPEAERYEADCPCIVAGYVNDIDSYHEDCLQRGFKNWLNVAVVSDSCESVSQCDEAALIAQFNNDCQKDRWLSKMMNYRRQKT